MSAGEVRVGQGPVGGWGRGRPAEGTEKMLSCQAVEFRLIHSSGLESLVGF